MQHILSRVQTRLLVSSCQPMVLSKAAAHQSDRILIAGALQGPRQASLRHRPATRTQGGLSAKLGPRHG